MTSAIDYVHAREILDSRGTPTLEVDIYTKGGGFGRASVPSGASTGEYEAVELRDNDMSRYFGKGVDNAVCHVKETINPKLKGLNCLDQRQLDRILCEIDGSANKSRLGANTILAVSLAAARAGSDCLSIPLYRYLGGFLNATMPVPFVNIFNGGAHANNDIAIQEFMIVPHGAKSFRIAIQICSEVFFQLKKLLNKDGLSTAVGDEGGFASSLSSIDQVFEYMLQAVVLSGYKDQVSFALDVAASEFYHNSKYYPQGGLFLKDTTRSKKSKALLTNNKNKNDKGLNSDEMIDYLINLVDKYPICSIEDGLSENDWTGFSKLCAKLKQKNVLLVGDDLLVTSCERLKTAIDQQAVNAVLIKPNQIGTLTETLDCIKLAQNNNVKTIISHRSAETCDSFIADLAVAVGSMGIKTGSVCRSERVAKYNRLIRLEEQLYPDVIYNSL